MKASYERELPRGANGPSPAVEAGYSALNVTVETFHRVCRVAANFMTHVADADWTSRSLGGIEQKDSAPSQAENLILERGTSES